MPPPEWHQAFGKPMLCAVYWFLRVYWLPSPSIASSESSKVDLSSRWIIWSISEEKSIMVLFSLSWTQLADLSWYVPLEVRVSWVYINYLWSSDNLNSIFFPVEVGVSWILNPNPPSVLSHCQLPTKLPLDSWSFVQDFKIKQNNIKK